MHKLILALALTACGREDHKSSQPPSTPLLVGQCWRELEASGLSYEYWPQVKIAEVGVQLVVVDRQGQPSVYWISRYNLTHDQLRTTYELLECP